MANQNTSTSATDNKGTDTKEAQQPEGPKPLTEQQRLELMNKLASQLAPLTPNDRRHVLTAVATMLGVATQQRPATQPQRPAQQQNRSGR